MTFMTIIWYLDSVTSESYFVPIIISFVIQEYTPSKWLELVLLPSSWGRWWCEGSSYNGERIARLKIRRISRSIYGRARTNKVYCKAKAESSQAMNLEGDPKRAAKETFV